MNIKLQLHIAVHGWMKKLLADEIRGRDTFAHNSTRKASIKDVIESLGIPHTEIGRLVVNGQDVDFFYNVDDQDRLEVFPIQAPADPLTPSLLRPEPLPAFRFLADANVGKLATLLRMVGLDTAYPGQLPDEEMAGIAAREQRLLLTKDVQLLKRKVIGFGRLVRETEPVRQLAEIIHFYGLQDALHTYSRCLRCNTLLVPVDKSSVIDRLEPLTIKYYHAFRLCSTCDKIYWAGSHTDNMQHYLNAINRYQPLPD